MGHEAHELQKERYQIRSLHIGVYLSTHGGT